MSTNSKIGKRVTSIWRKQRHKANESYWDNNWRVCLHTNGNWHVCSGRSSCNCELAGVHGNAIKSGCESTEEDNTVGTDVRSDRGKMAPM